MSLAQSCALRSLVSRPTTSAGSRGKLHVRAVLKNPQEPQLSKSSACDLATVQTLQKRCSGLNGADMEACWAEAGCDVDDVTRQFATLVGEIQRQHEGGVRLRGRGRLHTVNHYARTSGQTMRPQQAGKVGSMPSRGHGRLHTVNRYQKQ